MTVMNAMTWVMQIGMGMATLIEFRSLCSLAASLLFYILAIR
jgi:hypothetical protein